MAQFLAILSLISKLFPVIVELVKTVEAAVPIGGQGAAKLSMFKAMLQSAYGHFTDTTVAFDALWPMLQPIIGSLVSMYNSSGLFKTTTK